ncbi:MAG: DNA polymerase III subunit delta [Faecalibacterium sp.]|jgi:DNA polymerase-3 subunit delta|nr:DNA polymerase III subunit delta [Faecalibacterium sp.]
MADLVKLRQRIEQGCPVFYFYSTESYLVRQEAAAVCGLLREGDAEATILDEPAPSLEAIVMAAGTISFFGTRRLVELPNLEPTAYSDKDIAEFCEILSSAENAVFVLSSTMNAERGTAQPAKRMQKLLDTCAKIGYVQLLAKPTEMQLRQQIVQRAAAQGANLSDSVAKTMLERSGEDAYLLENETDKLCALAGYGTVTSGMVAQAGTAQLDARVFDLIDLVTVRNSTGACQKLQELLRLQNEPIPIAASLIGSYVDMYRVRLGQAARRSYSTVFKDFGYKGNSFRLKHAQDAAAHYTVPQLEACLLILLELDKGLKSSPVGPEIQLETGICRLCAAGGHL